MGRKVMFTFILTFLGVPVSQWGTIVFERMLRLQKALQPEEWTEVTLPDNRWKWRCQHRWPDGWRSCDRETSQPTFPLFLFFPSCFCATLHLYVFVSWQQEFASRLHHHVVREYIGQLMKNNYSCKNRKHEKAAAKIRLQWDDLRDLFQEMVINCLKNKQQLFHLKGKIRVNLQPSIYNSFWIILTDFENEIHLKKIDSIPNHFSILYIDIQYMND